MSIRRHLHYTRRCLCMSVCDSHN